MKGYGDIHPDVPYEDRQLMCYLDLGTVFAVAFILACVLGVLLEGLVF